MQSSAETAGQFFGMGIVFLTPLIFIVLNGVALRSRRTQPKCALAIIGTLLAIMLFGFAGLGARAGHVPAPVVGILGLVAVAALIASTVLAILGLVEISGRRRFKHGRKRAIAALALNFLFFASFAFGAIQGTINARAAALQPAAVAGAPVVSEPWNFRLQPPPEWSQLQPATFGPLARAAFARHRPEMYSIVVAENIPDGGATSLAGAMDLIKHAIRGNGPVEFLAEAEQTAQARAWRTLESREKKAGGAFFHAHWLTQHNGTFYRIVTWGAEAEATLIRLEARRMVGGFQINDPRRNALDPAELANPSFASPRFAYSVDLRGTDWTRRWKNAETANPSAEFAVLNAAGNGGFSIIPVWLGEAEVPLDILTRALLARVEVPFPGGHISEDTPCQQNALRGRGLVFERAVNGEEFGCRARILHGRGFAYLLVAWIAKASGPAAGALDEPIDRVVFADAVPAGLPQPSERERENHALVYNEIGLGFEQDGRLDEASSWFLRAFETSRSNPIMLTNYVQTALRNGQAKAAVTYLESVLDRFPGNHKIGALRATAQYQAGDPDGAMRTHAALFAAGWKSDPDFSGYIRELGTRGEHAAAFKAIDQYAGAAENPLTSRLRAELLVAKGDIDQAIGQLAALRDQTPSDSETSLALADTYFAAKRPSDALAECERFIALRGDSVEILHRQGLAEYALKRYREAKKSFEKALAKAPANAEVRRLLESVSGQLGEGSNSAVKTPIEQVAIPDALRTRLKAAADDEYVRGYSAWYHYTIRAIHFQPGQEFKVTEAQKMEIRDQQGVEKFSSLQFPFDPVGEEIFVNSLTVRDADGKVISQGKVEESYVIDQGTDQTASQGKILHVPVAGLRPGCTVESIVTRRENGPHKTFSFQRATLAKALPVWRSSLRVEAPAESIRYESTAGLPAPQRAADALTWTVEKPAVYRWEPLQALPETFLPMVWIGDAATTWTGESRDYLKLIGDRLASDEKVRAAAMESLRGSKTPAAKIAALARFVQREIAYKAIEFGRRARVPNGAGQTLRAKYGDCKDHAVLLTQLLDAAGIPAHLALVNSGSDLRPTLPSLDQFDHMIVYLPAEKGGRFLDCTGKYSDLRADPPPGLATRRALILDPSSPRLQSIPSYPLESSVLESKRDVTFSSETDVAVKEEVLVSGVFAAGLRASFLAIEPPQRLRHLQRILGGAAVALDLAEVEFEHLDDPQAPLRLLLSYTLHGRFHVADDRLAGQLPAVWERLYLAADADPQRFTPFQIWIPARFTSQSRITPPPGWEADPPHAAPVDTPYFKGTMKASTEGSVLLVASTLQQRAGSFAPAQYREYLSAARQTTALVEQNVVLKRVRQ